MFLVSLETEHVIWNALEWLRQRPVTGCLERVF